VKHPRFAAIPKAIEAVEKAGQPVGAVELIWETRDDGREVMVFRLLRGKIVVQQERAGEELEP
jgi:hypothetical protein